MEFQKGEQVRCRGSLLEAALATDSQTPHIQHVILVTLVDLSLTPTEATVGEVISWCSRREEVQAHII